MRRRWYSDSFWIPWFRRCRVGEDKVELTHPLFFGRGFIFDRSQRMVTMRRYLFGLPVSKKEIPFPNASIHLRVRGARPTFNQHGKKTGMTTKLRIELAVGHEGEVTVWDEDPLDLGTSNGERMIAAIKKLGL